MGANVLANVMGMLDKPDDPIIDGSCIVQAPMKMWETGDHISNSLCGIYHRVLGKNLKKLML